MRNFNPEIFRTYDIRGICGKDFDAEFAQRLSMKVASSLHAGLFVVGRDGRSSGEQLAYAVRDGALHIGAHVIDLGHVSTPQFQWAVRAYGARGGIMVTASHNPDEYNGFKVIGAHDDVIGGDRLRQIYDGHESSHRTGGTSESRDPIPEYAATVAYSAKWRGGMALTVSLDAPPPVRRVFELLGPIAPTDNLGVRCDADGDRILLYAHGQQVPVEAVFLVVAETFRLQPLVIDLRFSRAVHERLRDRGVPYSVSRVGRLSMTRTMRDCGAVFGGEISGHYYWKEIGGMESPELTLLRLYQAIGGDDERLYSLAATYLPYFRSDEVNIPIRDHKHAAAVMAKVRRHFPADAASSLDGLSVDCWDQGFWFNIRPSNTEPVLRLIVEAKEKTLRDQMIAEIREWIGA